MENIEGKGENADNQCFLLIPQYFQKPSSYGLAALRIREQNNLIKTF